MTFICFDNGSHGRSSWHIKISHMFKDFFFVQLDLFIYIIHLRKCCLVKSRLIYLADVLEAKFKRQNVGLMLMRWRYNSMLHSTNVSVCPQGECLCPGGLCLRGCLSGKSLSRRNLCPGVIYVQGGSLSRGISVQGVSVWECLEWRPLSRLPLQRSVASLLECILI